MNGTIGGFGVEAGEVAVTTDVEGSNAPWCSCRVCSGWDGDSRGGGGGGGLMFWVTGTDGKDCCGRQ